MAPFVALGQASWLDSIPITRSEACSLEDAPESLLGNQPCAVKHVGPNPNEMLHILPWMQPRPTARPCPTATNSDPNPNPNPNPSPNPFSTNA